MKAMSGNPVLHREIRRLRFNSTMGSRKWYYIALSILFGLVYFEGIIQVASASVADAGSVWMGLSILQLVVMLFVVPAISAGAFSTEREQQTWDSLVSTPLTNIEIVGGKLLGKLFLSSLIMAIPLPLSVFALVRNADSATHITAETIFLGYSDLFVTLVLFVTVSLFCSLILRKTVHAVAASYALLFGVLTIGTVIASFLLSWLLPLQVDPFGYLLGLNPFSVLFHCMSVSDGHTTALPAILPLTAYAGLSIVLFIWMTMKMRTINKSKPVR